MLLTLSLQAHFELLGRDPCTLGVPSSRAPVTCGDVAPTPEPCIPLKPQCEQTVRLSVAAGGNRLSECVPGATGVVRLPAEGHRRMSVTQGCAVRLHRIV